MSLLHIVLVLVLLVIVVSIAVETYRAENKKKTLLRNITIGVPVVVGLLLFGPLFMISPIKLGHTVAHDGSSTIIYPNKLAHEAQHFTEAIQQAKVSVTSIYDEEVPTQFLLVGSSLDMLRFGGSATSRAGGSGSIAGVFIRQDRIDVGVITHELSHRHLQEITGKISPYYPRWFDEGLATYLGHTGQMERYTDEGVLKDSLKNGTYQRDLDYWKGLLGHLRWSFIDCRQRPREIYTQAFFMVQFLAEEYSEDKLRLLVRECKTSPSFEEAFQKIYGLSTEIFHEHFLKNLAPAPY